MSEADLGIRLFLMDEASQGLTGFGRLLTGLYLSMQPLSRLFRSLSGDTAPFEQSLAQMASQFAANDEAIAANALEMSMLQAGMDQTIASAARVDAAFASGSISSSEHGAAITRLGEEYDLYDERLLRTQAEQQALIDQQAELDAAMQGTTAEMEAANLQQQLMAAGMTALITSAMLFAGLAVLMKVSIDAANDLQQAMILVQQNVRGASDAMGPLQEELVHLADNSKYSADLVAQGFAELGARGQDAAAILGHSGALGQAMVDLATAMGQDGVKGAADVLGMTLQIFGANASQAAHYADVLDIAFHNGIPDVSQLSEAFRQAGPAAAALHVPVEELATYLDILTQRMGSGSMAGTSLRGALQNLQSPTAGAIKTMTDLGIVTFQNSQQFKQFEQQLAASGQAGATAASQFDGTVAGLKELHDAAVKAGIKGMPADWYSWALSIHALGNAFYDARGNFIGLEGVLKRLHEALQGKNFEEANRILSQLFTNRTGLKAIEDLLNNYNQTVQAANRLRGAMAGQGQAARDAAAFNQSLAGRMKALGSTMHDLLGQLGKPFAEAIAGIAAHLNQIADKLVVFLQHNPQIRQMIAQFIALAAALSGVGVVVALVVLLFSSFSGVIGIILAVVLGISGLTVWLQRLGGALSQNTGLLAGFKALVMDVWNSLKQLWATVQSDHNALGELGDAFHQLGAALAPLMPYLQMLGVLLLALLVGVLSGVVHGLTMFVLGIVHVLTGLALLAAGITNIWHSFVQFGEAIAKTFQAMASGNWAGVDAAWQKAWNTLVKGVVQILQGLGHILMGLILGALGPIIGFVWGFIVGIIGFFHHLADVLVGHSIVPDMLNAIKRWFFTIPIQILNHIIAWVAQLITTFAHLAAQAWAWVVHMWNTIRMYFMMYLMMIVVYVQAEWNRLVAVIHNAATQIWATVVNMWNTVRATFMMYLMMIVVWVQAEWNHMVAVVRNAGSQIWAAVVNAWNNVRSTVQSVLANIVAFCITQWNNITNGVRNAGSNIQNAASNAWNNVRNTTQSIISSLPGIVSGGFANVIGTINGFAGQALSAGANIVNNIAAGIRSAIGAVVGAMGDVGNAIMSHLPHSPADEGPLRYIDQPMPKMMAMFAQGIRGGIPGIKGAMSDAAVAMVPDVSSRFHTPTTRQIAGQAGGVGGGNVYTTTIPISLDGREFVRLFHNSVTGELKLSGYGRINR